MPLDLRTNPVPPPAPPAPPLGQPMPLPGGTAYHARMPTPGEFYDLARMGPRELEALDKLDWPADLPVPDNLREIATAVVEVNTSYQDRLAQITGSGHVAKPGEPVDFASLPAEHRRQIVDAVRRFHADRVAGSGPAIPAGVSPSVAQAMRDIDAQVQMNIPPPAPTFVPPLQPFSLPLTSQQPPTAAPTFVPPLQPFSLPLASQPQTMPAAPPLPYAAPTQPQATAADVPPGFCAHCGWDQSRPSDIEPTEDDKLAYLASVLAPGRRFTRAAQFAGGIRVVFRSMSSAEAEACRRQLSQDLQLGRHADELAGLTALYDYRFVLALDSIDMNGRPAWQATPLDEIAHDESDATALPALVRYLLTHVLTADGLRRAIHREHQRFVKLCDLMADRLDQPDFFATAARRP